MKDDRLISLNAAIEALWHSVEDERGELQSYAEAVISDAEDAIQALPSAQPVEDARAMCGECDAWNQYKNYSQEREKHEAE